MTEKSWGSPASVADAVRRKWETGQVLAALHTDEVREDSRSLFPLRIRILGPGREEISHDFERAQTWARTLKDAARTQGWELVTRNVRVPALGTQPLPVAAIVPTADVALALLTPAQRRDAGVFDGCLRMLRKSPLETPLRRVAVKRPHGVIAAGADWALLVAAAEWVSGNPRPGIYLRQIPVAGMHTKLIETHSALFARMLEAVLPPESVDFDAARFSQRFGFRGLPRHVRIRGPRPALGLPSGDAYGDAFWTIDDLAQLSPDRMGIREVVVVENQTSFLVVPARSDRLMLWGVGNQADDLLKQLPWVAAVRLKYWGDLDTHGYAILARARKAAPHVESVLMDLDTLSAHLSYCVTERTQSTADPLELTEAERRVFDGLRAGTWGTRVRLEQELIQYEHVRRAFSRD